MELLGGVQPLQGRVRQHHLPRLFESGANRAPNMAIIGTVLHRSFLRRLVDLVVPS